MLPIVKGKVTLKYFTMDINYFEVTPKIIKNRKFI